MASSFNSSTPDEELVILAREDSSGVAMQELLQRVSGFIHLKAYQFGQTEQDKQDFYQEGLLGFLSAVHSFKPGSGASFSTFACTCALNRMKNLLKQRSKADSLMQKLPLEGASSDLGQAFQAAFEAENIITAISSKLSIYEKRVLFLYLQGDSYAEIAQKTDKSVKSTDNAMQRIRRKLKSAIDD